VTITIPESFSEKLLEIIDAIDFPTNGYTPQPKVKIFSIENWRSMADRGILIRNDDENFNETFAGSISWVDEFGIIEGRETTAALRDAMLQALVNGLKAAADNGDVVYSFAGPPRRTESLDKYAFRLRLKRLC
jgi:hypothetical protein